MSKSKSVVVAALMLTGTLAARVSMAGPVDVQWSIVIGSPVYAQPVPVYTRPWPVYTPPLPVVTRPWPVQARPAPVWVASAPAYRRGGYWQATRWDRDGDGIPNRYDRYPQDRHDRDGDGARHGHDRQNSGTGRGR